MVRLAEVVEPRLKMPPPGKPVFPVMTQLFTVTFAWSLKIPPPIDGTWLLASPFVMVKPLKLTTAPGLTVKMR